MAGHYANFANVSHSDYEFTITFARVDHEVEDEEIPGVVVSRINLSPRFMRELIDAMEDNYSKWRTREGIKNLPEFDGPPALPATTSTLRRALRARTPRDPDALDRRRVRRQNSDEPARRVGVGDVLQRDAALEADERLGLVGEAAARRSRRAPRPGARAGWRRSVTPKHDDRDARAPARAAPPAPGRGSCGRQRAASARRPRTAPAGVTSATYSSPRGTSW